MRKIKLTKNKFTLVDNEDFEFLNQFRWCFADGYAVKRQGRANLPLHRFLLVPPKNKEIDHKNGNGLDNRRNNLRICIRKENGRNRKLSKNNTSGYKGVVYCRTEQRKKRWMASIRVDGIKKTIGRYFTHKEAAIAYNVAASKYFKDFANLNDVRL